jgi:hypothetical protein
MPAMDTPLNSAVQEARRRAREARARAFMAVS